MSSRMAVSYQGRFRALGIQTASYATCSGAKCEIPNTLPADHPPTLFLHGAKDEVVPASTSLLYENALKKAKIETKRIVNPSEGHTWFKDSAKHIVEWFQAH